ncbi:MAG: GNAT family N-acetyltransferase [Rhodothermales bacterium]
MSNIETERLVLRLWKTEDFDQFAEYYADESNAKYVGGVKSLDEAWRHFALLIGHWQLKGFGYWAVDEKSTGNFVGCVGLWQSAGWPELELGYWLLKENQGKGYASEAALKSREYARETLKAESLVSYIDPNNTPSIKLAKSINARYEHDIQLLKHGRHCVYRHF